MKLLSLALVSSAATAELHFRPLPASARRVRRALLSGGSLAGLWGQFEHDGEGFCLGKIRDPTDEDSAKVKFVRCDNTKAFQLWKVDAGDGYDADGGHQVYDGLLQSMTGGCLAVRGTVKEGKHLKVLECNQNSSKQHWSIGDGLFLGDYNNLCVGSKTLPVGNRCPALLLKCEDTHSLDY